MRRAPIVLTLGALSVALGAACTTSDPATARCHDIPKDGCPDEGQGCADPTCGALYSCNPDGTWSHDQICPGFDASAPSDASPPAQDASPARDVDIDAPPGANGGPGCADLQSPDCPLGLALACPPNGADPCCGCESLFVCAQGGWDPWGNCSPDAGITASP